MSSISTFRRLNALSLFQAFAEERITAGDPPKGLEAAWAARIEVSGATWSMAKSGARPICAAARRLGGVGRGGRPL